MGPVSVQPSRVLTSYGVPVGLVVNCLETVAVNASAPIRIPIRLSLIAGDCSEGENGLCRSHSTIQFELLAFETPPLLLRTQEF